ncbi:MAG: hypothetical protein IJ002_01345 [Clostridia bacterium]|nr:hypothetical protein [Clostridia bacterium]
MKKLLSVILAGLMVLALAACGDDNKGSEENKGEKLTLYGETWEGDDVMLAVDFYYPADAGITLEGDEEYPNWIDMHYNDKNITISPAIFEDTTFDANKEYAKENEETYEEFKLNGYNCYAYEDFGGYWIYVHLEELSETTDRYLVIDTEVIDYSIDDTPEGKAHYEDKDIKKIIDSFEYRGLVEYPEEEAEK